MLVILHLLGSSQADLLGVAPSVLADSSEPFPRFHLGRALAHGRESTAVGGQLVQARLAVSCGASHLPQVTSLSTPEQILQCLPRQSKGARADSPGLPATRGQGHGAGHRGVPRRSCAAGCSRKDSSCGGCQVAPGNHRHKESPAAQQVGVPATLCSLLHKAATQLKVWLTSAVTVQ